jgi:hypothetical protein
MRPRTVIPSPIIPPAVTYLVRMALVVGCRGYPQLGDIGLASRHQTDSVQPMTTTLTDRLVVQAMTLATDVFDDDTAMVELRQLAIDDNKALEQAIRTCLAQPTSLATRHRAIELLARVRYEDPPTTA